MANYREDIVDIELTGGNIHRGFAQKTLGVGDNNANHFGVRLFRNGEPEPITGGCYGLFVRADGTTVAIPNGTVSGNVAYVILPDECYDVEGVFSLAIKLTGGGVTGTMRIVDGMVTKTSTDTPVDPGTIITGIDELIEAINDAVELIPADYTALSKSAATGKIQDGSGRTTVCVPLGPVKENTIITKGTGIDRAGSGNNFATQEFIPVPAGTFYVISKLISFYIVGYSANFEHMEDIGAEDDVHAAGMIEIDNSEHGFSYIRIGFYTSTGYTAAKYAAAEVLYYTEVTQKSKELIMSQRLGPRTVTGLSGTDSIEYSSVRIGPEQFVKAEKNIQIIRDGNASHNWRYLLVLNSTVNAGKTGGDAVADDWNNSTQAAYGITIPKGAWYWLGYSYGTDNAVNVDTAIKEAPEHIHIRELEDGEPGYYALGSSFDVFLTALARVGVADKIYADTDLFLTSLDDDYVFSLKLYADGDWDSSAWTAFYSVRSAYIPKGSWFRYNVGKSDGSAINEKDIGSVYRKVGIFENWNRKADVIKQVIGLQKDLSDVRKRINALEQNEVPSYYETHIASKAATINARNEAMTTGDQFVFITDPHINGYGGNTMHSKPLINYLMRNTTVRKVFNGGDLLNTGTGKSAGETLDIIQDALIYTQPDDCGGVQYFVTGNHDTGVDYPGGTQYGPSITAEQLQRANGNDAKRAALVFDPNSDAEYYFDQNGIRYIVSDFGVDTYTGESIGNTYLFVSKAIKSAPGPVVVIQHILWNSTTEDPSFRPYRLQQLENIVDACNSRGTCQYGDSADYLVDFADSTAHVCCIIGGHLHIDRYSYTEGGVPIIATTTDNWKAEAELGLTDRTNAGGTINEQAFDVFTVDVGNGKVYATWIGYGSDRQFDIPSIGD